VQFNPPNLAYCPDVNSLSCHVHSIGAVLYVNYTPNPLDNITFRPEIYADRRVGGPAQAAAHDITK
jgi:hypothetical protein